MAGPITTANTCQMTNLPWLVSGPEVADRFGIGASVLVCWKHSYIVKLLEQLGCGEEQGCPAKWSRKDFDTIVSVQYARSPPADDEQPAETAAFAV